MLYILTAADGLVGQNPRQSTLFKASQFTAGAFFAPYHPWHATNPSCFCDCDGKESAITGSSKAAKRRVPCSFYEQKVSWHQMTTCYWGWMGLSCPCHATACLLALETTEKALVLPGYAHAKVRTRVDKGW